mmetsp:Transcript_31999/g.42222  ORF Transcript_31999/g.42222 Transcript_31999/m.42222 type:complete len:135 (+) Transcript_31999:160-564(+)|eukprot:CAMPEP_0117765708 /NCGR_PEP_ID=MMETSP0947-20121206/20319_1 /TAXON_ID=44440 /ORGANISM="Chattonella subsalsa, Strain CCMP2191" /LENGTH=134 /DNA_ID=CAMNT_0005588507 /DNA_START=143 /DNA_END=547 /DNA_ORIENTATION=+
MKQRRGDKAEAQQEEDDETTSLVPPPQKSRKEGIRWMPIVFLFLFVGPACLPGVFWIFDKIAQSDFGKSMGLYEEPRVRLEKFYREHNPSKLGEVDKMLKKYKGREDELFKRLERVYAERRKEAEYYEEADKYN